MLARLQRIKSAIVFFNLDDVRVLAHDDTSIEIDMNHTTFRISDGEGTAVKVTYDSHATHMERNFPSHDALNTWLTTPPAVLTSGGFEDYFRKLLTSIDEYNVYFKLANANWEIRTKKLDECFTAHVRLTCADEEFYFKFFAFFTVYDAKGEIGCFFRSKNKQKAVHDEIALKEWLTTPTTEHS